MKKKNFVGIDVSKDTIDVNLHGLKTSREYVNSEKGFKQMKVWIESCIDDQSGLVICFEHTGIYAVPLQLFCEQEGLDYIQVSGLEVKRSLGIQRGKNDQIDSKRLAGYIYLHRDTLKLTRLASKNMVKLKYLLSFRSRLVRQRAGFKATMEDYKKFLQLTQDEILIKGQKELIKELSKQIKEAEKEIINLINADEKTKQQYELATSVKGIGPIISAYMIVSTNCFRDYTKWRKYACYAGSAPFDHSSGTSIHGKTRISHYANKAIKALLTNGAKAAIMHDPEIKRYYERKIQEGKHKKIVVNNVRNKLISRVFATINRGTPFVNTAGYAG